MTIFQSFFQIGIAVGLGLVIGGFLPGFYIIKKFGGR